MDNPTPTNPTPPPPAPTPIESGPSYEKPAEAGFPQPPAAPTPPMPPVVSQPVQQPIEKPKSKNNFLMVVATILLIMAVGAIGYFVYKNLIAKSPAIASYEDCTKAKGSVIQESFPPVCVTKNGQRFVQEVSPTPTPTPDITANWKVFTASSFSIKYPSDWAEPTTQLLSGDTRHVFQPNNLTITVGSGGIYSQTLGKKESYDEIVTNENKNAPNTKDIIVSRIPAKEYINTIGASTIEPEVVLNGPNNNVYIISMPFPTGTDPALFDQILSTFKFLDESQSKTNCQSPRPEVCTMECIEPPPYICGSDGKSYCTACQACSNKDVAWYKMSTTPCEQ